MKEIGGIAIVEIPQDASATFIATDVSGKEYKLSRFYLKPEGPYCGVVEVLSHKKILRAMFSQVFFVPRFYCLIALNSGWDAFSLKGSNLYPNLPPFASAKELLEQLKKDFDVKNNVMNLKEVPVKDFAERLFPVVNILTHDNKLISLRKYLWLGRYGVTNAEGTHRVLPALSDNIQIRIEIPHEAIVVDTHEFGCKAYSFDGEPLFKGSCMSLQRLNALLKDRSKDWPHLGWQY